MSEQKLDYSHQKMITIIPEKTAEELTKWEDELCTEILQALRSKNLRDKFLTLCEIQRALTLKEESPND